MAIVELVWLLCTAGALRAPLCTAHTLGDLKSRSAAGDSDSERD
jgi:hypothetical protein